MKRFVAYILLLCTMFSFVSIADAEDANNALVIESESTKAYLVNMMEKTYLLGYVEPAILEAKMPGQNVDYVVQYCTHEEHVAQKQELANQLNAALITVDELPEQMQVGTAVVFNSWAFSAEEKVSGVETFDCVGNYLRFAASTNESSVNVRETPTTKGKRVDKLKRGDVLTVIGQVVNDKGETWYQVELANGKVGYIRSDLLSVADEVPETKETAAAEDKKETRYIGNKKSKVFHRPGCGHLPSSKNIVYFSSRSYAIAKGYKPCSICDP